MQIDTAGTYTLKYTAEDECGNVTEVTREVEAVVLSYRTVLYTDGTLIINEKSTDINANVAKHGVATNVYVPHEVTTESGDNYRGGTPWYNQRTSVKTVEFGSKVQPISLRRWFEGCSNCEAFNFTNLDTSKVTLLSSMFDRCSSIEAIDCSSFNTEKVTDAGQMFMDCTNLESVNLDGWDTTLLKDFQRMFMNCTSLTALDLSMFLGNGLSFAEAFLGCTALQTIYASSNWTEESWGTGSGAFRDCRSLRGGAGTVWNSSYVNADYARIDGGTSDPGYFTAKA